MNKNNIRHIFKTGTGCIIALTCFFYACDTTPKPPDELIPPVVHLNYPDSNGLLINGDSISFEGSISDNKELNSMLLTIEGMQGQLYYEYNPNVTGLTEFEFNTPWVVSGIPYDTLGYLNLLVSDVNNNYTYFHWYMRLRD